MKGCYGCPGKRMVYIQEVKETRRDIKLDRVEKPLMLTMVPGEEPGLGHEIGNLIVDLLPLR